MSLLAWLVALSLYIAIPLPPQYVMIVGRALTLSMVVMILLALEKLNVREAREKLEIVQLKIKDSHKQNKMFHGVVNAFMYNLKEQYVDA